MVYYWLLMYGLECIFIWIIVFLFSIPCQDGRDYENRIEDIETVIVWRLHPFSPAKFDLREYHWGQCCIIAFMVALTYHAGSGKNNVLCPQFRYLEKKQTPEVTKSDRSKRRTIVTHGNPSQSTVETRNPPSRVKARFFGAHGAEVLSAVGYRHNMQQV